MHNGGDAVFSGAKHSGNKIAKLRFEGISLLAILCVWTSTGAAVLAQTQIAVPQNNENAAQADGKDPSGSEALLGDIIVTGTKQSRGSINQKVPVAITALGSKQIEALKIGDFTQIASQVPGVSFEQTTQRSTVNFSIRGLGVNSSKISTAPAVGTFVNGVYMGVNTGIFFDTFDMEGIEVMRGPQGTLFGRNVTGGAVLLNYKKPRSEPDMTVRARVESGPEYNLAVAGGGELAHNLSARVAAFYDHDLGYFDAPLLRDKHYGETKTFVVRPSIRFNNGGTDVTLFGEYGRITGDGPPSFAPDYRGAASTSVPGTMPERGRRYNDLMVSFRGYTHIEYYSGTLDFRQDVDFGDDAAITSITGYRHIESDSNVDLDATPLALAHSSSFVRQHQFSQELRYNGTFGPATITTGLYYFNQWAQQILEQAQINAAQGSQLKENVSAIFGQVDFNLTDALSLQIGGRYTHEKKDAKIASQASQNPNVAQPGTFGVPGSCRVLSAARDASCTYPFSGSEAFSNFSPKVSVRYQLPNALFYATAQKAYRSGGFNASQNSSFLQAPFDPEKQTAYELGFKSDLFGRKTRLNGAVYLTKIKGLQRDVIAFDAATRTSPSQTLNTADATIKGFEVELTQQIIPHVVLTGSVSRTHARYDKILFDITGDRVITALDLSQRLPRTIPWTYGFALNADHEFDFGRLSSRASWSHRDTSYFTDSNRSRTDGANTELGEADLFDLTFSFEPAKSKFNFTLYGRNLGNDFTFGNFTPLGYPNARGCACFPNKGRVLGIEVTVGL